MLHIKHQLKIKKAVVNVTVNICTCQEKCSGNILGMCCVNIKKKHVFVSFLAATILKQSFVLL